MLDADKERFFIVQSISHGKVSVWQLLQKSCYFISGRLERTSAIFGKFL